METQKQEPSKFQTASQLNGVNLEALKGIISSVQENPTLGAFKFRSTNQWLEGGHNRTVIKGFSGCGKDFTGDRFTIECDSPEVLLGTNTAADPVEYVLHALSACMTSTIAYHSATKGIAINKMDSSFEGDLDLSGFLGLSETVKKGFKEIRAVFNVETDAKESELRELLTFSPVYEMVSAGVPVKVEFKINKPVLS